MMTNVLLAILIIVSGGIFALLVGFAWKLKALERGVRDFVSAKDEKTPSPLAQTVEGISLIFARTILANLKTSLMGMNSQAAKAAAREAEASAMQQVPWLGILQSFAPGILRSLAKNPALLNFAVQKFGGNHQTATSVSSPPQESE